MWTRFDGIAAAVGPVDVVVVNGDSIDGKGAKSGGIEQITADRKEQVKMAAVCLKRFAGRPKFFFSYGTAYHVGSEGEDYEQDLVEAVKGERIGAHEWLDARGCIIDFKHHLGSSSVPYGRATAISKEWVWNALWAARGEQPSADIIIRSHVHYYAMVRTADYCAIATPALQAMGSVFGARRCSGTVDWGLLVLNVRGKRDFDVEEHIVKLDSTKAKAVKL